MNEINRNELAKERSIAIDERELPRELNSKKASLPDNSQISFDSYQLANVSSDRDSSADWGSIILQIIAMLYMVYAKSILSQLIAGLFLPGLIYVLSRQSKNKDLLLYYPPLFFVFVVFSNLAGYNHFHFFNIVPIVLIIIVLSMELKKMVQLFPILCLGGYIVNYVLYITKIYILIQPDVLVILIGLLLFLYMKLTDN